MSGKGFSVGVALAIAVVAVMPSTPAAAAPPRRIVSMNMCADQYLLALAEPSQVAALTSFSRDPSMSFYARRARSWPVSKGSAEEVMSLHPDLIIASPFRRKEALALLNGRGAPILEIKPARTYADVVKQVRLVARAIGAAPRGEVVIAEMDRKMAVLDAQTPRFGVAAYYQRRGFVSGTGTLMDDMMTRAGFTNLARPLRLKSVSKLSLEAVVAARPSFLIVDSEADPGADMGSQMLFHPALERTVPASHRLSLPQAMSVCGGPFYPDAVAMLRRQGLAASR